MSQIINLLWNLTRGQRLRYFSAITALVVASCFLYLVPLVPTATIDGVLSDNPDTSALTDHIVTFMGGREYVRHNLWVPAAVIAVLAFFAGLFTYLRGRWSAIASETITRDIRNRLYDRLQKLPMSYHDKQQTGDQVQRCTSDVETLRLFLSTQVVETGRAIIMLLVPVPLMYMLDPRMTLLSLALVPPIVVFALVFFRRVRSAFKQTDEAEGRMTTRLQENLTGIRVVRAFARQEHEKELFRSRNSEHRRLDYRLYKLMAWYWAGSDLMCFTQKALVVGGGAYWVWKVELAVGTFYFFLSAVGLFIWPVRMMGRILTDMGKATVAMGRLREILEATTEDELDEERFAGETETTHTPTELPPEERTPGSIVFQDVHFSHGETPVLRGISFRVSAGKTLAILGPSGCGKSTIVNLLLRLYDHDSGQIFISGRNIRAMTRVELRRQIASVLQEPFLFSKSIRENISLARAHSDDREIMEAAATACVHENIEKFDKGYDTLVGEKGVTLSGGQRQRVSLARALLQEPAVLILDDALSAVDTRTETMIIEALQQRRGRHTTIVIAHRLSTLRHADQILVMDHGEIIEQGTHEELIARRGRYHSLWKIQTELVDDLHIGSANDTSPGVN